MNAIRAALASAEPLELIDAGTGIPAGGLAFGLGVVAGLITVVFGAGCTRAT